MEHEISLMYKKPHDKLVKMLKLKISDEALKSFKFTTEIEDKSGTRKFVAEPYEIIQCSIK